MKYPYIVNYPYSEPRSHWNLVSFIFSRWNTCLLTFDKGKFRFILVATRFEEVRAVTIQLIDFF